MAELGYRSIARDRAGADVARWAASRVIAQTLPRLLPIFIPKPPPVVIAMLVGMAIGVLLHRALHGGQRALSPGWSRVCYQAPGGNYSTFGYPSFPSCGAVNNNPFPAPGTIFTLAYQWRGPSILPSIWVLREVYQRVSGNAASPFTAIMPIAAPVGRSVTMPVAAIDGIWQRPIEDVIGSIYADAQSVRDATIDDKVRIPPHVAPWRDAWQKGILTDTTQSTRRVYDLPDKLPLPWARPIDQPVIGREIVITRPAVDALPVAHTLPIRLPIVISDVYFPPRPGTKEIKVRAYPIVQAFLNKVIGIPSEINDLLQAWHDALPKKCQRNSAKRQRQDKAIRAQGGRYNARYRRAKNSTWDMMQALAKCGAEANIADAVANMIENEIMDQAHGRPGQAVGKTSRAADMPVGIEAMTSKHRRPDQYLQPRARRPALPKYTVNDLVSRVRENPKATSRVKYMMAK